MTSAHTVRRGLIVAGSSLLRETLECALGRRFDEVQGVGCVSDACAALEKFHADLMVLDFELPDGTAVDVLQAVLATERLPLALAISGTATPGEAFRLAQLGVRIYLPKPLDLVRLERALDEVIHTPAEIGAQVRTLVGQRSIQEVEEEVRRTMLREALGRAEGSRRTAAKLLQISRQRVQHMLRREGID